MKFEIGQTLWFVKNFSKGKLGDEVVVEKVGRVWVTLSNRMRCDFDGVVDGGNYSSPGRIWESKEIYDKEIEQKLSWDHFKEAICRMERPYPFDIEMLGNVLRTLREATGENK